MAEGAKIVLQVKILPFQKTSSVWSVMKDEPEGNFDFKLTGILTNPLEWGWSSWTFHEVLVHFH